MTEGPATNLAPTPPLHSPFRGDLEPVTPCAGNLMPVMVLAHQMASESFLLLGLKANGPQQSRLL